MFSPEFFNSMTSQVSSADLKLMCQQMALMSDEELAKHAAKLGNAGLSPQAMRAAANSMASFDDNTLDQIKQQTTQRMKQAPPPAAPAPAKTSSLPQNKIKEEGNKLFSQGAYLDAIEKYQQAIVELASAALSEEVIALEVTCRLNIANCCSKLKDYDRAIEESRKTLVFGDNPKANYRIAFSLDKMNKTEEAWEYILKSKKASSNDPAILSLFNDLKSKTGKAEPVQEQVTVTQPPQQSPAANLNLPNISKEEMDKGLTQLKSLTPETRKQYFEMLQNTDPRLLQEVFKSQGLNMEPEQIAKMRDFITEDKLNELTSMLGSGEGSGSATSADTIQQAAANPQMRKMISEMLSKQVGRPAEELEKYINIIQKVTGFFLGARRVYKKATDGWRKYVWLGGFVACIAYLLS